MPLLWAGIASLDPPSTGAAGFLLIVTFIHLCVMLVVLGAKGLDLIGFVPYFFVDVELFVRNLKEGFRLALFDVDMYKDGAPIYSFDFILYDVLGWIEWLFDTLAFISVIVIVVCWLIQRYKKKVTVEGDAK